MRMVMKVHFAPIVLLLALLFAFASVAPAAELMLNYNNVPAGWTTDRYAPVSFTNIGTFAGKSDVLSIGISEADGLGSRPAGQNSTFYNTQGMQHALTGGIGDTLSAALWVPASWADQSMGSRRTDMWGVMSDGSPNVSGYPIIGFTNYGGAGRFRAWEDTAGAWVDLAVPVTYDQWTDLSIKLTASDSYEYRVNGTLVYTDTTANGSTAFSAVIMQAYNFTGDPSLTGAVAGNGLGNYPALWANTVSAPPVPEPATYAMMGLGLAALGLTARRKKA